MKEISCGFKNMQFVNQKCIKNRKLTDWKTTYNVYVLIKCIILSSIDPCVAYLIDFSVDVVLVFSLDFLMDLSTVFVVSQFLVPHRACLLCKFCCVMQY